MKKLTVRVAFCLFVAFLGLSANIHAQAMTVNDVKAQLVKEWERAKTYTVAYLNTMPADKYSFKAVDSLRSFAQQMIHLSMANLFLMSTAIDQAPLSWLRQDLENVAAAQNKDSVMYFVTTSYDYCINAVKNSDPAKWGENKKIFGMDATRFGLMIKTFEHQTHHRGQTTIYIRLLGIKPPQEMLF